MDHLLTEVPLIPVDRPKKSEKKRKEVPTILLENRQ
jgi:hypothetical protein